MRADLFEFRYFRQLQELSDTVTEAQWEDSLQNAIAKLQQERAELDVKINAGRARQRYLDHLAKAQGDGGAGDDEGCCILCKCEFTRGYITGWYAVVIVHSPLVQLTFCFLQVLMCSVRYAPMNHSTTEVVLDFSFFSHV